MHRSSSEYKTRVTCNVLLPNLFIFIAKFLPDVLKPNFLGRCLLQLAFSITDEKDLSSTNHRGCPLLLAKKHYLYSSTPKSARHANFGASSENNCKLACSHEIKRARYDETLLNTRHIPTPLLYDHKRSIVAVVKGKLANDFLFRLSHTISLQDEPFLVGCKRVQYFALEMHSEIFNYFNFLANGESQASNADQLHYYLNN